MRAQRAFFGVILFTLFLTTVFAYEESLSVFGFTGISNDKAFSSDCKTLLISVPDVSKDSNTRGILSLSAVFTDYQQDSSYVSVSINGAPEEILWPEDFSCAQHCWARLFVPNLETTEVPVKICTVLGGVSKKVEVTTDSFLGLYDTPVLSIENQSPAQIFLGERAKMSIIVSNTGVKAANVFVQFVHPDTRARVVISSFDIVEGDSSASTTIEPNQTKEFVYYIKPTVLSTYNLPSAALFFTNLFGERQTIISEHPQMSVVSYNRVDVSLVALSNSAPYSFKAIIKNNWPVEFDGNIIISPQTALQNPITGLSIPAGEEKEIVFAANTLAQGKYSFFASINDTNNIYSSNKIDIEVKDAPIPYEVIIAVLAIIVGAGIFAWIYYQKS
jgi:azurin